MASPPCESSGRAASGGPSTTPAESTGEAAGSGRFSKSPLPQTGDAMSVPGFHWTREQRESSAGAVHEDETGANRTTGVRYRESAQHRRIASIGRMRVTFLQQPDRLPPAPPTGFRPAIDRPSPGRSHNGGKMERHGKGRRETNWPFLRSQGRFRGETPGTRWDLPARFQSALPLRPRVLFLPSPRSGV